MKESTYFMILFGLSQDELSSLNFTYFNDFADVLGYASTTKLKNP